ARRAARRKNKQPQNKSNQKTISLVAPKTATPGKEITLIISHTIPKKLGAQKVHITLKHGTKAKRLERKVITATGKGTKKITFTLPAKITDHQISFSAFVGPDYPNNLDHVTSKPISTQK
ncbi:MAG: heparan N-sulfatase, partial [Verrucomicrobia bacterium]|nr:heparan N-sulfatase [Verrucomicrobiota bacterium]